MIEWDDYNNIIPESYGIPVSVCPIAGPATTSEWSNFDRSTMTYSGRNRPSLGRWIIESFAKADDIGFDCMAGCGSLWMKSLSTHFKKVYFSDWSFQSFNILNLNLERFVRCGEVESFVMDISKSRLDQFEGDLPGFIMFSPPFRQNKSAGKGDRQREIVESKHMSIVESFKGGQLTDKAGFFETMRMAYQNIYFSTTDDARMYIILRNYIRKNKEVDEIGEHLNALKIADWKVKQMFVRDLVRPTAFQAWKLKKDPFMCWTRNEYVLELKKS